MGKFIDLTGHVFGRLKVIEYKGKMRWLCECSCSNHTPTIINGRSLRDDITKSCGCLFKEMLAQRSKILFRKNWNPQGIDENTYSIPLSKGQIALIDKEDLDKVKNYGWYATYDKIGKTFYATTRTHGTRIRMHRLILNAKEGQVVDHSDHNGLNNRKSNIRLCTQSQNCMNKRGQSNNSSGYKGVSYHKRKNKYQAMIMINRKQMYIGSFCTASEASEAYQKKAQELFGSFYYDQAGRTKHIQEAFKCSPTTSKK
jgi:hypothetical protein